MAGNSWDKVKEGIGKAAPFIGTLIGGPAGGGVGMLVADALGVENTPEAIGGALNSDPEALAKVRTVEMEHKARLQELALESDKAHMVDVQNARQAEVERMKAGGSNRFMYYLAGAIVTGFFAVVGALFFRAIPQESKDVAYILLGSLASEFVAICRYFFGSSKGSSDKMAVIASKGRQG